MTSSLNSRSDKLTREAVVLSVALFTVFGYTFLHEAGHASVGMAFGQTLTRFNVNFFNLDAHVRMAGVLTPVQSAVKSAAGTAFPLLVSAAAVGFYVAGWLVFLSKIDGIRNQIRLIRGGSPAITAGVRKTLLVMGRTVLVLAALTVAANNLAGASDSARFFSTQDYSTVAEIDLAQHAYQSETLAQFTLEQEGEVGIFVTIEGLDTPYLSLSMSGPDGFLATIVRGEGFKADSYADRWQHILPPGEYRLILDANQSSGLLSISVRTP